jgi:hypothetical protein
MLLDEHWGLAGAKRILASDSSRISSLAHDQAIAVSQWLAGVSQGRVSDPIPIIFPPQSTQGNLLSPEQRYTLAFEMIDYFERAMGGDHGHQMR